MKMKDERNVNYPGMFDLLKGIVLIGITLSHIKGNFPGGIPYDGELALLKKCLFALPEIFSFGNATLQILFLISGYGFTAIPLKKCIRKQAKQLLRPFLLTGAAVAVVHFVSHFLTFRNLPGATKQTAIVVLSHLLGLQSGFQFHGVQLCFCGSVWFLMALFEGWVIQTAVMNCLPKQAHGFLAICFLFASAVIHFLLPAWIAFPFCLYTLLLCAGNLYLGMQIKKRNWLWIPLPSFAIFLMVLLAVLGQILPFLQIKSFSMFLFLLFVYVVASECTAFLLMRVAVRINHWNNWLIQKVRLVGRYSIWILCAHTIESQGLLWYLFVEKMQGHELAAFLIMAVVRGILIFAICYLINLFDKRFRKARKRRKASAPV